MSDNGIIWEDPPPAENGSGVWIQTLAPLIEHPKRWAMVRKGSNGHCARMMATNLRHGRVKMPPGQWEFTARKDQVYARYMGGES